MELLELHAHMHAWTHTLTHINTQWRPDKERVFRGGGGGISRQTAWGHTPISDQSLRDAQPFPCFCFSPKQKTKNCSTFQLLTQQFLIKTHTGFVTTVSLVSQHKSNTWSRLLFQSRQELSGQKVVECLWWQLECVDRREALNRRTCRFSLLIELP